MIAAVTFPRGMRALFILAVVAMACSSFEPPGAYVRVPEASPFAKVFVGGPEESGIRAADTVELTSVGAPEPERLPDNGAWVVRAREDTLTVWDKPRQDAAVRFAIAATNPWNQQIAFPLLNDRRSLGGRIWYRILMGIEPNGSRGWIRAADVSMERASHRIVVDMSDRTLRHFRAGRLRHRFRVGIGAPDTPTVPGQFFVWAHLRPRDPNGAYGSYLLGLSGFSEVLTYWPGGGRMAIHGTPTSSDRGREVSFGCVRVYNRQMNRLRDVPMGTLVVLRL